MTEDVYELYDEIVWGETYEEVTKQKITHQSRWYTFFEQVFKKKEDGTFWLLSWRRGSTELQDDGLEDIKIIQVEPKEVTVTIYEAIKNG